MKPNELLLRRAEEYAFEYMETLNEKRYSLPKNKLKGFQFLMNRFRQTGLRQMK